MGKLQERNTSLDCLRVLSMFMVVLMHALGHGRILETCKIYTLDYIFFWLLRAMAYPCVNCFVLISGYYLSGKSDYSKQLPKLFRLWVEVITYSIIGYGISIAINHTYDLKDILKVISPISSGEYWFMTCYCLLFLAFPLFNTIQNALIRKQHLILIGSLLIIFSFIPSLLFWTKEILSSGRDIFWFITLYFIAGYIKKYGFPVQKKVCIYLYLVGTIGALLTNIAITVIRHSNAAANLFYYNNSPFILVSSLGLWGFFLKHNINNSLSNSIANISKYSIGVYLLHENRFLRPVIWDSFDFISFLNKGIMHTFCLTLLVFAVCISIYFVGSNLEHIRQFIYYHSFLGKIERNIDQSKISKCYLFFIESFRI